MHHPTDRIAHTTAFVNIFERDVNKIYVRQSHRIFRGFHRNETSLEVKDALGQRHVQRVLQADLDRNHLVLPARQRALWVAVTQHTLIGTIYCTPSANLWLYNTHP